MSPRRQWTGLALLGLLAFTASGAAQTTLNFSQFSSDSTPASVLDATVTFTVQGSQLRIDISNDSAYKIAQLYFNTDATLTGLSFNSAGATNTKWDITGTGATQSLGADGMGRYNWEIDFGSGNNRLAAGSDTTLILDMTGTTAASTIGTKFSVNPPGSVTTLGVVKFEAGPGGDSAFGGSNDSDGPPPPPPPPPPVNEVPAPATLVFAALGCGLGLVVRSRRRANVVKG